MDGNNNQTTNSNETIQDEIMSRVNQTFDKITQDVKNMINDNNQQNNLQ